MSSCAQSDVPKSFTKRIHRALRAWHTQHAKDALDDLLLAQQPGVKHKRVSPRLISNQILLDGLDSLKQDDVGAADLLQRRFPNQETARKVAYSWNWSEDIVFQRQRAAIVQLSRLIWEQEMELRQERAQKVEARLEPPTYSRLFGVDEKTAEVRALLETRAEPWLIALEGLGGIGKTTLADALARQLACETHFQEIGWVSARQRLFRLSGDVESLAHRPDLTLDELVERLVDQFDLKEMRRWSVPDKLAGVRDLLKSQLCLVIVDNLETVSNYGALVSQLRGLAGPSKFLITTRYSLHDASGVYVMTLRQLSRQDTLALIRHEAETRGLRELARAPEAELEQIYDVTGGNPLAAKLLIGQVHTLSLPLALDRFSSARGKPIEELLDFIHAHAWESLDQDNRRVLQAMLLVPKAGGRLEQLAAAAELELYDAAACLQRLATLSLVNVGGDLAERRYSLHQLTHTFLTRQLSEHG
jgi:DNA polymerase III delta prime subunit